MYTLPTSVYSRNPGGTPHPVIPPRSNVRLLLQATGTISGTTYPGADGSDYGVTVTRNGTAITINAASVAPGFGDSLYGGTGTGNANALRIAADTIPAFGTGDFTVECWMRRTQDVDVSCRILQMGVEASGHISFVSSSSVAAGPGYPSGNRRVSISAGTTSASVVLGTTARLSTATYHHLACCRKSNMLMFFHNGVLIEEKPDFTDYPAGAWAFFNGNAPPTNSGSRNLPGYIDDVRVVHGIACYTKNFTLPTEPHVLV